MTSKTPTSDDIWRIQFLTGLLSPFTPKWDWRLEMNRPFKFDTLCGAIDICLRTVLTRRRYRGHGCRDPLSGQGQTAGQWRIPPLGPVGARLAMIPFKSCGSPEGDGLRAAQAP